MENNTLQNETMNQPAQFVRRVYFDRNTLEIVNAYKMVGDFTVSSIEQDWETFPVLRENAYRKDDIDVLEWSSPDPEVEAMCEQASWLGVRRSDANPSGYELYDATDELPEYIDPESEASQILNFLQSGAAVPTSLPKSQRAQLEAFRGAVDSMRAVLTDQQMIEVENLFEAQGFNEVAETPMRVNGVLGFKDNIFDQK